MIAVDTSTILHFLAGSQGVDVEAFDAALAQNQACLPPVVLSELLSSPDLSAELAQLLIQLPILELVPGFWERAGRLRASVVASGHKAKLADTLVAQSCLDHRVALITRDADFRHFRSAGLRLIDC